MLGSNGGPGKGVEANAPSTEDFAWPGLDEIDMSAKPHLGNAAEFDLPDPIEDVAARGEDDAAAAAETDWAKKNKAFRANASSWSCTKPAPRLAILMQVVGITSHLMYRLMKVSSAEWFAEQEVLPARGLPSSYRILEGANGTDAGRFVEEVMAQFLQSPRAVPAWAQTKGTRTLHFRLLSRAVCSLHFLLRKPRQGQPFQLFTMLSHGDPARYRPGPRCMEDELSSEFYKVFPAWTQKAEACLRTLAFAVHMDVAAIESKHATARRLLSVKNVQAWVTTLETLSAEWTHRQVQSRAQWLPRNLVASLAISIGSSRFPLSKGSMLEGVQ